MLCTLPEAGWAPHRPLVASQQTKGQSSSPSKVASALPKPMTLREVPPKPRQDGWVSCVRTGVCLSAASFCLGLGSLVRLQDTTDTMPRAHRAWADGHLELAGGLGPRPAGLTAGSAPQPAAMQRTGGAQGRAEADEAVAST